MNPSTEEGERIFIAQWERRKTKRTDFLAILPRPFTGDNWIACSYDGLATHAALSTNPGGDIFPSLSAFKLNSALNDFSARYLLDHSNTKPRKFTVDLTSHSVRSGAWNNMHRKSDLKVEWVDMRIGYKDRLKSKENKRSYLQREAATDFPCALISSGWDNILHGGRCRYRNLLFI